MSRLETQALETDRLSLLEKDGKDKLGEFDTLKQAHETSLVNLKDVESRLESALKGAGSHEELRSTWLREIDEKRRVSNCSNQI
jgi:hypothetical protein